MARLRRRQTRDVSSIERPRTTACVLSGGGHMGAIQVGMIKAMVEAGIQPDAYICCSVGALNGTVMAAYPGPEGVAIIEETWSRLRTEELFPGNTVRTAWKIARREDHLYSNAGLIRLITQSLPVTHFHHLQVPLRIVATDLITGKERIFATGPLLRPLLATTAMPGVFPPVRIGSSTFVDGGVVNNVPISHAAAADRIIVLSVSDTENRDEIPSSSLGLVLRSFEISRVNRFRLDLERYRSQSEIHLVEPPEWPKDVKFPDLSRTSDMIDLGYASAKPVFDAMTTASEPQSA